MSVSEDIIAAAGQKRSERDSELGVTSIGPCYGRQRERYGPALSLELRFLNGSVETLEYAHRWRLYSPGPDQIVWISDTGLKVTLVGIRLKTLRWDLSRHLGAFVQVLDRLEVQRQQTQPAEVPLIYELQVERGKIDHQTGDWLPAAGQWDAQSLSWQASPPAASRHR